MNRDNRKRDDPMRLDVYRDQYRRLTTKEHAYSDAAKSLTQDVNEATAELSRVKGRLEEVKRRKKALLEVAELDGFDEDMLHDD